ncbi:MAG: radical SAM protein [Thermoprotei archaeon]|nr:MAG: radical SAM protein [Thermoprotei archaeon]
MTYDKSPSFIVWIFTAKCNLNCRHCYTYRFRKLCELTLDEKIELVRELAEIGINHLNITGGEPLIHRDIRRILDVIYDLGLDVSIVTNATYIPRDIVSYLKKVDAYLYISVDGPKEVHDTIRGVGSFEKTCKNIKMLRDNDIPFTIVMAINRLNYNYVEKVIDLALELGAEEAALIPVMPSGKAMETKIYIDGSNLVRAVKAAEKKADELGYNIALWCMPFAPLIIKSPYMRYYFCRTYDVVDISPCGELLACDIIDIKVTNIRGKGFKKAWEEYVENETIANIVDPKDLEEPCVKCPIKNYCKGGCFARSYVWFGRLNAGDPLCPMVSKKASKPI